MMAIRKIPLRKCIGCNTSKDKRELIRVVRNAEGEISIDTTGKKPGRGAYICKDAQCLKLARKGKKLDKAFEVAISEEIYDRLEQELADE
ncbi:MAG: YlxR family protein [Oscillospiraceae bacterium]|nr:YlxR family protein [Oscillospiraceae bacterium]